MAKITINIESIKENLKKIGYCVSNCIERINYGKNWQITFSNSASIVTIYDTNKTRNSVVNGKCNDIEKIKLKKLVDDIKCNELVIDDINEKILKLIDSKKEDFYYDFKQEWYSKDKKADLLHDILCLANNLENIDSYLIIGVNDNYDVLDNVNMIKLNDILDFLKHKSFAGDHIPHIDLIKVYYQYKELYVVKIISSKNVPFFLTESFQSVIANQIYTRLGDTNTPKSECACYKDIEKLWGFHFERSE